MNHSRIVLVALFAINALSCLSSAEAAAPREKAAAPATGRSGHLSERVERVAVFKDGYGLFTRTATATVAADGTVFTERIPEGAVLGSFWATAKNAELRSMRAETFEESLPTHHDEACVSTAELIRANPGREVLLQLQDETLRGKLGALLERPVDLAAEREAGTVPRSPRAGGRLVVLEQAGGERLILPLGEVKRISGKGLATRCAIEQVERRTGKRLIFDLGPEAAGKKVTLSLMYFAPGIRWIPTYRLELEGERKGELALQAELLNEVEDLEGSRIDLVVGVPNFRFKSVASPLTLERALRNVLARSAPELMGMGNDLSNALFTQRSGEHRSASAPIGREIPGPELPPDAPQDLEVYHLPPMALQVGGRMSVPLWQRRIDTTHVHTVDLALDALRDARGLSPLKLSRNEVWHQLELTNPGSQAWTTGPVLVLRDGIPIAQELLTYTPPGRTTLLPLTIAVNLRTKVTESETERDPEARRLHGRSWYAVKRRGQIEIDSAVGRPVELRIRLDTEGKVTEAGTGTVELHDGAGPNNRSRVLWTVKLKPGNQRSLRFESEAFVG